MGWVNELDWGRTPLLGKNPSPGCNHRNGQKGPSRGETALLGLKPETGGNTRNRPNARNGETTGLGRNKQDAAPSAVQAPGMAGQVGRECYLELRGSAPCRHAAIVVPGLEELPLRLLSRASAARLPPEGSTMEYEWAVPTAQLASILQASSLTCVRCYISNSMHAAGESHGMNG